MTDQSLSGAALITGGNKNIGRAIAIAFATAGCDVAVVANTDRAGADEVAAEVRRLGRRAYATTANLGDPEDCERLVGEAVDEVGPISHLVSNAAARPLQDFMSITVDDWNQVLASNLSATFYLARLVLPAMADVGFGRVIAVGGPDGQRAVPNRAHNVTCKAGLIGLTKAISIEFGRHGVTANVVTPGIMNTTRDPKNYPDWPPTQERLEQRLHIPRMGESAEIADLCVFLCGARASYITGQTIHVSGGLYTP